MLHGKILRNAVPHVRNRSIDAMAAPAISGAGVVLTYDELKNLPDRFYRWGPSSSGRCIAVDKLRDVNAPVAAVDEAAPADARDVTLVDHQMLPHVTSSSAVVMERATRVHEKLEKLKDDYRYGEALPVEGTDVFQRWHYQSGDVKKVFKSAAHIARNPHSYETETK